MGPKPTDVPSFDSMAFSATTGEVQDSLRVSKQTLTRLRSAEILRPGVHFTAFGLGLKRPNLRWDLPAVEETLARRGKQIARPRSAADRA